MSSHLKTNGLKRALLPNNIGKNGLKSQSGATIRAGNRAAPDI